MKFSVFLISSRNVNILNALITSLSSLICFVFPPKIQMSIGFKNALLDYKKSYIRYISHELRTPLNTAYLGLKLLSGMIHLFSFLFNFLFFLYFFSCSYGTFYFDI